MPKKRVQHGFTIEDLKAIMDSMTANDQSDLSLPKLTLEMPKRTTTAEQKEQAAALEARAEAQAEKERIAEEKKAAKKAAKKELKKHVEEALAKVGNRIDKMEREVERIEEAVEGLQ